MDNTKQLAALAALNDMMAKGYVNICTVDSVAKMLDINCKCVEYDILRTIHCVQFDRMPKELFDKVPALVQKCLSGNFIFRFNIEQVPGGPPMFAVKELA